MANLTETAEWVDAIYQLATTDPVLGGDPDLDQGLGLSNVQAQQLAKRTAWLKAAVAANAMLDRLKEVDGAGSGLDADLLDGKQASAFLQKTGGRIIGATTFKGRPIVDVINNWIEFQADDQFRSLFKVLRDESEIWSMVATAAGDLDFRPIDGSRDLLMGGHRLWHDGQSQRSFSVNGYQIFPNGLVLQWGTGTTSSEDVATDISFPIAFPSNCLAVLASDRMTAGSDISFVHAIGVRSYNRQSFEAVSRDVASGSQANSSLSFVAIGY